MEYYVLLINNFYCYYCYLYYFSRHTISYTARGLTNFIHLEIKNKLHYISY